MAKKTPTRKSPATKRQRRKSKAPDLSHIAEELRPLAVPIDSLTPDPHNARQHGERNLATIAASLAQFGQVKPIVIVAGGTVIAGNGTIEAAQQIGWTHVAAVTFPDAAQARAYALADNRTAELAEWDRKLLQLNLDEIAGLDLDFDAASIGFSDDELQSLLVEPNAPEGGTTESTEQTEVTEDDPPAPPKKPKTKPGDLWLLGEHRLLCGDSTKADDVARLMDGERAGLMNTDPPYGIAYDNSSGIHPDNGPIAGKIENDQFTDEELQAFLESAFRPAVAHALAEDAAWYLWHAMLTQGYFAAAAAAAANVVLHRQIIWVKQQLVFGRGQYHWKHELAFFGWVDGHQPPDYGAGNGERNQTTVWEIAGVPNAERKEYNHSTPKPVELFAIPIRKHLQPGEICYEPFAGSGPQLIAAEQLGRRCYALEISPAYCDVIVKRWETLTGHKATREKRPSRKAA